MSQEDLKKYIAGLSLGKPPARYPSFRSEPGTRAAAPAERSYLNTRSLVSFVSQITDQRRKDVLNSTLLAQLAATKKFPDDAQIVDWYKEFITVLQTIGWNIESAEFSVFKASKDLFEVESAIIDILTAAFGGDYMTVITKTLDSIKALKDGDGKLIAFEKNTHSLTKGAFQIGVATEEQGVVALQLGTFLLSSSNEIKRILFFKSTKDRTRLDYCSRKGTLNEEVYATIRETVKTKLGTKVAEFVTEIEI